MTDTCADAYANTSYYECKSKVEIGEQVETKLEVDDHPLNTGPLVWLIVQAL